MLADSLLLRSTEKTLLKQHKVKKELQANSQRRVLHTNAWAHEKGPDDEMISFVRQVGKGVLKTGKESNIDEMRTAAWPVIKGRNAIGDCGQATNIQVPCKDVILHARSSSSKENNIKKLASVPLTHSEDGVHKVFEEAGCLLPVQMNHVDLPTQKAVPYVTMSSWVKFLVSTNRLKYLIGTSVVSERESLCSEFWARFEKIRPRHPIFSMARGGKVQLKDAIPILHHGDEGRTYRKSPIMILSTHGMLGTGCSKADIKQDSNVAMHENPMLLNMLGSTITTQFIFTALPQKIYKDCPEALDQMLSIYSEDLRTLALDGVKVLEAGKAKKLWFWCLGAKGDLPYLGKCGHFNRTYSMCAKQASSKSFCGGICWDCLAGKEGMDINCPWEDMRVNATWISTSAVSPGWGSPGPLLRVPHDMPTWFYRADLWHCFHLGSGKSFAASAVVVLAEALEMSFRTVDARLDFLTADFLAFCKRTKRYSYVTSLSKDFLGWEHRNHMPQGHWHKGFITTTLLEWLEDFMTRHFLDTTDALVLEIVSLQKVDQALLVCFWFV
ncbi:hypothetical protein AK812_SmicGene32295 [Symbiodinium microadriaticum]|uniref:Uncharacterized protein n=1 Tax=Symbiodinium microadriaticum TaxID=2951 RepID=A0A1Q9CUI2_SYMMI|nr:hypothetical protein AK812_SmicGene32295 [Symbiodinium microadriaticum]CAE7875722.1 unnamed protein product [Symbiodinium microadriaticum]